MIKRRLLSISFILVYSISQYVTAAETKDYCQNYTLDKSAEKALPRLAKMSKAIVDNFCRGELTSERDIAIQIENMLSESGREFNSIGIDRNVFPYTKVVKEVQAAVADKMSVPNMIEIPAAFGVGVSIGGADITVPADKLADCNIKAEAAGAGSCSGLISAYSEIYNYSQDLIENIHTAPVLKYIRLSRQEWDDYYEKSRSQTALERAINGALWRRDKKPGQFLAPPDKQYIVLHPSIVIENVSEALDGSNTREGIMIELFGMNWWRHDKWYQPSGFSLTTVYTDRPLIKDWGYGLALHFGNDFTIGAVDHDGSTGVFISVDVLTLFKDKRALMDDYLGGLTH